MAQHERDKILRLLATLDREHLAGKHDALQLAIITLLCGGHLLLEDRPGLGTRDRPPFRPGAVYQ